MITATSVWTRGDWLDALDALETRGPLPRRLVVLPSAAAVLAFRRAAIEARRADLLLGTEVTTVAELTARAGVEPPLDPAVREILVRRAAGAPGRCDLEVLDRDAIASGGLCVAAARAIAELEAADLCARDLEASADPIARDLGRLWRAHGGATARYTEAIDAVVDRIGAIDATVAVIDGSESAGEAAVIRALPGLALAVVCGRPDTPEHRRRIAALFGHAAADALDRIPPRPGLGDEARLLSSYLFEHPARAAASRPPSGGCDGSARLEVHASEADEVDAAVDWVCRQVLDFATRLDRIAIIVERLDPWASRLCAALERLRLPVNVAGGVPLAATAEGARLLADPDAQVSAATAARVNDAIRALMRHGRIERHEIIELVSRLRVDTGASEPAIFVGTAVEARGIDFAAVRFIGLGPGEPTPELDPDAPGARGPADRRRARDQAIAAVTRVAARVAMSAARAAGPIMHAAARAIGRAPGAGEGDGWAEATPVTEQMWLRRIAGGRATAPGSWRRGDALDPLAILEVARGLELQRLEGPGDLPGLDPDRPITAAQLGALITCPHGFVLESLVAPDRPARGTRLALPTIAGPLHVIDGPRLPAAIRAIADELAGGDGASERDRELGGRQLDAAGALLSDREMPRARRPGACQGCRFEPVCGPVADAGALLISPRQVGLELYFDLERRSP